VGLGLLGLFAGGIWLGITLTRAIWRLLFHTTWL
jgi:hypothetical protein